MSLLLRFYVLGLLIAGILAVRALKMKDRETLVRCRTLAVMVSVLILVLASGQWGIAILCALLSILAFDELGHVQPERKTFLSGMGWAFALCFPVLPLLPHRILLTPFVGGISLLVFLAAFLGLQASASVSAPLLAALVAHVACGLTAIMLIGISNVGQFLALIFLLQFNDGFAYIAGRAWGRTPLAPSISPRKSVEGVAGGLVAAACIMFVMRTPLLPVFSDEHPLYSAGLVLIVVGFGIGGDLLYSLAKRRAGLKDFASRLPGHGGVLDRLDSLLAVLPVILLWNLWWI